VAAGYRSILSYANMFFGFWMHEPKHEEQWKDGF
jgi:hypothetical protein